MGPRRMGRGRQVRVAAENVGARERCVRWGASRRGVSRASRAGSLGERRGGACLERVHAKICGEFGAQMCLRSGRSVRSETTGVALLGRGFRDLPIDRRWDADGMRNSPLVLAWTRRKGGARRIGARSSRESPISKRQGGSMPPCDAPEPPVRSHTASWSRCPDATCARIATRRKGAAPAHPHRA